jgi:competence/damage-inducible protein CinA-like protein
MRCEIVAIGTELLLGQITDTNSTYIAEQFSASGIDCHYQVRVGDNIARIVEALEVALGRAEAVIVCGGLGPTQDDLTREAIAQVMGVGLYRDDEALRLLVSVFAARNRTMTDNNLQQADVPIGATIIPQVMGTAPGLICPVGEKVIYAVPGVPDEMKEMLARAVLPDLLRRSGEVAVILSRTLRTWGLGESALAEVITPRVDALDAAGPGAPTIAFLASGIEGVKVRVTVKAESEKAANVRLDAEEAELRALIGEAVCGIDDETMEYAVGELLVAHGLTLGLAESFTGGILAARAVAVPGSSRWFTGGIVSYASAVKEELLGLSGPVVSVEAAAAMAAGVRELLHTDVGLSTTGVAGPDPQEGHEPGTAFAGLALPGAGAFGTQLRLFGGRNRVREMGTIAAYDLLRRTLLNL